MTTPLISCIVPVFNGERYIREALDSILAQTYRPLDIVVADDGSTDGTAAAVASYGDRVRYLWQPNAGLATARNLGLAAARRELVAFLDADDLWHPEKLARQVARFRARPELDFCITHVQNFWISELSAEAEWYRNRRRGQPLPGYTPCALLARRTLFEQVGPYDPALGQAHDTAWFVRAAERGAISEVLPEVLVYRRLHRTNISRTHAATAREEYLRFLKAALDRRRGRNVVADPSAGLDRPPR